MALACWRLKRSARIAVLLAGGLSLLAAELALRAVGVANPVRAEWLEPLTGAPLDAPAYWPDGELIYRYPDNPRGYFDADHQVLGHINAEGYRGALYAPERTPGKLRIAVLGDSFTLGIGVRDEHTLPAQLEAALGSERCEVLNFGVSASDTPQQVGYLLGRVLQFSPDLVVLVFFLNDAERGPTMEYLTRPRALLTLRRYSFLLNGVVGMLERALQRGEMRRHYREGYEDASPGWQHVREALLRARDALRERDITLVVAVHPILVDLDPTDYPFSGIHATLVEFCRAQEIEVVDLFAALSGFSDRELWVHGNDQHPNERAHAASAAWLAGALRERDLLRAGGVGW